MNAKLFLFFALSVFVPLILVTAQRFLGPKQANPVKEEPFECGNPFYGNPWATFPVKFYTIALLFLLFDVEVVTLLLFVYGGAKLGASVFLGVLFFFAVLAVGFIYSWRMKAFDWD